MSNGSGCCGGGGCCGNKGGGDIDRRDFLKAAAAGAGGLALLGSAGPRKGVDAAVTEDALRAWTADLWRPGQRRVYRGEELKEIAIPLGGIGAGQVYLTGSGRLASWQITNNFNTAAGAPGALFAAWARPEGGEAVVRALQQGDEAGRPGVTAIEVSGEYPYAWFQYLDGQLPVDVSLEAHTPFIPLQADESGLPLALFRFSLRNRSAQPVEAAILASVPNLVGWDGYGKHEGVGGVDYIGNRNTFRSDEGAGMVVLEARPGETDALTEARRLYSGDDEVSYLLRHCLNLEVQEPKSLPNAEEAGGAILWLSRASGHALAAVLEAVEKGAGLVAGGGDDSLLSLASVADAASQESVVFEDWEKGSYDGWALEGDCFGEAPATGTLPNQQTVSGWQGQRLVNTFVQGDGTKGRAVSKAFGIEKRYIHLQVGGGDHPGRTCVNLRIGDRVVESATGENTEHLRPVRWDVDAYRGRSARIEIVDDETGGWGHVLVGDIVFSDAPQMPFVDAALAQRVREALPFTWTSSTAGEPSGIRADSALLEGVAQLPRRFEGYRRLEGVELKPGAEVLLATEDGTPLVVAGRLGQGRVVVINGPLLASLEPGARKRVAGRLAATAGGVDYTLQSGWPVDSMLQGSMALAVLRDEGVEVTARPQWDDAESLWGDFEQDGRLEAGSDDRPSAPGRTWCGAVSGSVRLEAGEERAVTVALAWHFPNRTRDGRYGWGPGPFRYDHRLGNRYNTRFGHASEVVAHYVADRSRLDEDTRRFHRTFYDSSLPRWLLDSVTANIANLRSPIFVWIEDGTFGGFEGADSCCPMNCTHVYNYAMTTAYLFPELERNVRETDLLVQMHPEKHFIPHRTVLPLSLPRLGDEIGGPHHHALDGELGTILKTCREWRITGDREWLEKLWPRVKLVMEHVMRDHDADGTGVLRGEQPNTYDTHLFGSNTFVGSLYLAALRATEEMAKAMGDGAFAERCRARFESGRDGYEKTCWNGEYYENVFDAPGATPETYNDNNCYGPGCFSDQLLGQWWAYLLDLGPVLVPDHITAALNATYRHNWRADLSDHRHTQRVFAEGAEKGLLTGTWPRGGRPERPILYCDEVWTGIEYQVAASLIYAGEVEKGLQIAKGARDRYTGNQRNPWAEVECGHHYARALSSYSLLHALAGYDYDGAAGRLTFAPRVDADPFRAFFTTGSGWGTLTRSAKSDGPALVVEVAFGSVRLQRLCFRGDGQVVSVTSGGGELASESRSSGELVEVALAAEVVVKAGERLEIRTGRSGHSAA